MRLAEQMFVHGTVCTRDSCAVGVRGLVATPHAATVCLARPSRDCETSAALCDAHLAPLTAVPYLYNSFDAVHFAFL